MKRIPLTQGRFALVDDADVNLLSRYKWTYNNGYAMRKGRGGVWIGMHRVIAQAGPDQHVDHRNGDTLDNRRHNLRICTVRQNVCNTPPRPGTSRYKGVYAHKRSGRWVAAITHGGKKQHLGYFDTQEEAARAYDQAAARLFGEYAWLNFAPPGHVQHSI